MTLKCGNFIRELKNRFLCEVEVDDKVEECYVPSSCHLSNFLQLKGKRVILLPTQGKNSRTRFALYATPHKKNCIILNTSLSNVAVENSIHSRRFSFLGARKEIVREHYVNGYKADLYIPESRTIIEIKCVLSSDKEAVFPTVYSERTQKQLKMIQDVLDEGYRVVFLIVSLNPYLKRIKIDKDSDFYLELQKCIKKGMELRAYTSYLKNKSVFIKQEISVSDMNC